MGLILAWMYSTSELDELFLILNSIKGFKLDNHKGATQHLHVVHPGILHHETLKACP